MGQGDVAPGTGYMSRLWSKEAAPLEIKVVEDWFDHEGTGLRFLATIDISGTLFHLDAIAVEVGPESDDPDELCRVMRAIDPELQQMVEDILSVDPDDLMQTTTLPDKEHRFLIVATPYHE